MRGRSGSAAAWAKLKVRVVAHFLGELSKQFGTWIPSRKQTRIAERAFDITRRRSRRHPTWDDALWDGKGILARLVVACLRQSGRLGRTYPQRVSAESFIGETARAARVRVEIEGASGSELNVLIVGETGTGKDLVAQAIHSLSLRRRRDLIAYNCAGMSTDLVASDLFGHVRGAFTGAIANRIGLIEEAHESHLLLDEVEAMPLEHQAKLLRVIEDGRVRPLGARDKDARVVSVRYLAATNRSPRSLMAEGKLRADLYHRISGRKIELPALRDRPADIPVLARDFLGADARALTQDAVKALQAYHWPGNVRELMSVLVSARETVAFRGERWIRGRDIASCIPEIEGAEEKAHCVEPSIGQSGPPNGSFHVHGTFADIKRQVATETLRQVGGNHSEAARRLGIDRKTLRASLKPSIPTQVS